MNSLIEGVKIGLLHVGYAKIRRYSYYENVVSPFSRLIYVKRGCAEVCHTNQIFVLKSGSLYLIPSYVYNNFKCEEDYEHYYIDFFEEIKYGLSIYNFKDFIYEVEAIASDKEYFERLLEINPKIAIVDTEPKFYTNQLFFKTSNTDDNVFFKNQYIETNGIISILLSRFIKNTSGLSEKETIEGDLNSIIIYIAKNLDKEITVEGLATYCSLNTDYFSRIFNKRFHTRPSKYIQQKRIERAQVLLLTTHDTLKQIAVKVGFQDIAHFSKTFKKITGNSPGKYRKNYITI
ncbi:transcriptional regulator, AraC family [Formosa agariphila KMM 3901]|uniref:Transcriptional regulator, AraC family n=1 Tax=Formosa agariphila (strain DSM 15362 / KCTC 12365 / LMG 23005 / KMM 3901 / M-2Alg 35-1) TaxID=1347342 RepID=T2KM28_FORAG|nr:AraC family transcriptional regulator [Formosa agariphila]CDF79780.1 transcriptional regulator, AraC family [Formosa agariphila KMM 3901]